MQEEHATRAFPTRALPTRRRELRHLEREGVIENPIKVAISQRGISIAEIYDTGPPRDPNTFQTLTDVLTRRVGSGRGEHALEGS